MIERQFISQKIKEHQIQEYIKSQLEKTGYSHTEIKRTPLGEKIIIYTARPGIVVGRRGENIQNLTKVLKKKFKMENPQIEIGEIENQMLDVHYVCDRIISTLERFGSKRFKSIGYRMLQEMMNAGAKGAEIVIAGKVPSARARTWRFSAGYLKKTGDISENYVLRANGSVKLKVGVVGVKVSIMPPDVEMPDKMVLKSDKEAEEKEEEKETKEEKKEETKEKKVKKKTEKDKKETKTKAKPKKEKVKEKIKIKEKPQTKKEEKPIEVKKVEEEKVKEDGNTKKE